MGKRLNLDEIKKLAIKKKWQCISDNYINNHTKMNWICNNGHNVHTSFLNFKYGKPGCSICSKKKKHTLEEIKVLAESKGGQCLSTEYINSSHPMKFQCKNGHEWFTSSSLALQGAWCWKCYKKRKVTMTIEKINEILKDRRMKCVSKEYINNRSKLQFECIKSHIWDASYDQVINRHTGCPHCANEDNICENICRNTFESYFNLKFKRVRPKWLKSNKNRNMELDGYNENLKLAFEYNGIQHYELDRYLNVNDQEKLKSIQERDKLKRKICKQKGIVLIEIPYTIPKKHLTEYILHEIKINKIKKISN